MFSAQNITTATKSWKSLSHSWEFVPSSGETTDNPTPESWIKRSPYFDAHLIRKYEHGIYREPYFEFVIEAAFGDTILSERLEAKSLEKAQEEATALLGLFLTLGVSALYPSQ